MIETVEDLHQGGLAGAVLAQQRMHFARLDIEVDMVAGQHAGETLDDALHLQVVDARQTGGQKIGRGGVASVVSVMRFVRVAYCVLRISENDLVLLRDFGRSHRLMKVKILFRSCLARAADCYANRIGLHVRAL